MVGKGLSQRRVECVAHFLRTTRLDTKYECLALVWAFAGTASSSLAKHHVNRDTSTAQDLLCALDKFLKSGRFETGVVMHLDFDASGLCCRFVLEQHAKNDLAVRH